MPVWKSWTYKDGDEQDWDEQDWERIKDLSFRNILDSRKREAEIAQHRACIKCPKFLQHVGLLNLINKYFTLLTISEFAMQHDEWVIREYITQLRQLMSDQNLQLLPDYEQRISALKDLGFIDENSRVELKGKVACEVRGP